MIKMIFYSDGFVLNEKAAAIANADKNSYIGCLPDQ